MTFHVRMKKRKKIAVLRVMCIFMIVAIIWFINWDVMKETLMEENAYMFFMGFIGIFILLFALSFYVQKRPRIEVNGQDIAFYPLWRPSLKITLPEITSRKAEADYTDPQKAMLAGILGGGLLAYAVLKKSEPSVKTPQAMTYTYFNGRVKLITVSTREMENVERFDKMVQAQLDGRPLEMESNNVEEGVEPARKKKHPFFLVALIVCVFVFVAFAAFKFTVASRTLEPQEEASDEPSSCTYETVTFDINPGWELLEDHDGTFVDRYTGIIYQINGVSQLNPYTPEDCYYELVNFYKQEYDPVISRPLEQSTSTDGAERYMANMVMVNGDIYIYMTIVIFPEKNTVTTFCAQTTLDKITRSDEEIIKAVENMAASAVVSGEGDSLVNALEGDILAGTSWIAENDGSQWVFNEDKSFHWYQEKGVTDDNYYAGTYEFHMGQDAINYLTSELSEFGVTEDEIKEVIYMREEYTLNNFVCFSTTNQSFMLNGEEQLSEERVTSYFGCLLPDGIHLDIANMTTGTYYSFTKE